MKKIILYSFYILTLISLFGCERDELDIIKDDNIVNGYDGELVSIPAEFVVNPFGGPDVKVENYKEKELIINDFWLLQFDGATNDSKFLAAIYHPHIEGETDLAKNYVKMAQEHLDATKTVWIVANIGEYKVTGDNVKHFSNYNDNTTLEDFLADGFPLSQLNSVKTINGGNSFIEDANKGLEIPLSGWCEFNSGVLSGIDDEKGLVVTLKSIVAKLTIDFEEVEDDVESVKLFRIPEKVSYAPDKITETTYKLLDYEFLIANPGTEDKQYTLYIPQNKQQKSTYPGNTNANTKTLNAPAKATYFSLNVKKSDTENVAINIFPGGDGDSVDSEKVDNNDNQYNNYNICANTHYTERVSITSDVIANYIDDKLTDTRIINRLRKDITSNCYILNPLTEVNAIGFNYKEKRIDFYSLPIIARNNEAWFGQNNSNSNTIGPNDEWKVEVIWQDVPGRIVYFLESSGLKAWKNTDGEVDKTGNDVTDNLNYSTVYLGKGNGANGYVSFYVKKETKTDRTEGNVLIGLRKKTGENSETGENTYGDIIWSWHLWITDYNPDKLIETGNNYALVPGDTDNSGVRDAKIFHYEYFGNNYKYIMDRHLGAMGWRPAGMFGAKNHNNENPEPNAIYETITHKGKQYTKAPECYGLYYQWGRKDPIPANDLMYHSEYLDNVNEGQQAYIDKYYPNNRNEFVSRLSANIQDLWDITGEDQLNTDGRNGSNSLIKGNAPFSGIWETHAKPTEVGADIYTSNNVNTPWGHPTKSWPTGNEDTKIVGVYTDIQKTKSLFDPCPPGWEIPESNAYNGIYGGKDYTTDNGTKKVNHYLSPGYAIAFHEVEGDDIISYGSDNRQAIINNGAWEIDVTGNADTERRPPTYQMISWIRDEYRGITADNSNLNTRTFYPPSGFVTSNGRKDMGGIGDVWASDVFNDSNGGYLYIGRSVGKYKFTGETNDVEWRNSGGTLYVNHTAFGFNHAFSVRCVKK